MLWFCLYFPFLYGRHQPVATDEWFFCESINAGPAICPVSQWEKEAAKSPISCQYWTRNSTHWFHAMLIFLYIFLIWSSNTTPKYNAQKLTLHWNVLVKFLSRMPCRDALPVWYLVKFPEIRTDIWPIFRASGQLWVQIRLGFSQTRSNVMPLMNASARLGVTWCHL